MWKIQNGSWLETWALPFASPCLVLFNLLSSGDDDHDDHDDHGYDDHDDHGYDDHDGDDDHGDDVYAQGFR